MGRGNWGRGMVVDGVCRARLMILVVLCLGGGVVGLLCLFAGTVRAAAAAADDGHARNVLFLLADDLGYGDIDVAPFGTGTIRTPHIARLAAQSTLMSNYHAAAPICTPSRAAMLTSIFPHRFNIRTVYGNNNPEAGHFLPRVPTIPEAFRAHGFRTGHFGKWHLGGMRHGDVQHRRQTKECSIPGPNQHGFDHYVSIEHGIDAWHNQEAKTGHLLYSQGAKHLVADDGVAPPSAGIVTDRYAKEAMQYMTAAQENGERFYVQIWFHAPHTPLEYIQPEATMYMDDTSVVPEVRQYRSMVSHLDTVVGQVLDYLDQRNLTENTLVLFTSDNGPEMGLGTTFPYHHRKRWLYEGGTIVPAMWRLPGVLPVRTTDQFGVGTDLFATMLEAAGLPLPGALRNPATTDGMSLWPMLTAASPESVPTENRTIFWHSTLAPTRWSVLHDGYKLIEGEGATPSSLGLYHLHTDRNETHNLLDRVRKGDRELQRIHSNLQRMTHAFRGTRQRFCATDPRNPSCAVPTVDEVKPFR